MWTGIFSVILAVLMIHPSDAVWSLMSNDDVYYFCKGDDQAITGYIFAPAQPGTPGPNPGPQPTPVPDRKSPTQPPNQPTQPPNEPEACPDDNANQVRKTRSIMQEKSVHVRVFCLGLDGGKSMKSNARITTNGPGSSKAREADEFGLSDGVDVEDKQKNCQDGEYLCGLKVSAGGSRLKNVCCKISNKYESDTSSGCRITGPMAYSTPNPTQVMIPSKANDGCSVDAATGLGMANDGIRVKTCSFKVKGKNVDPGCKSKKDQIAQEYTQRGGKI